MRERKIKHERFYRDIMAREIWHALKFHRDIELYSTFHVYVFTPRSFPLIIFIA